MILPTDAGVVVVGLALDDPAPELCELCGGTGVVSFPDPFFDGDLVDAVCPCGGGVGS